MTQSGTKPDVSIIIPVHNAESFLVESIDSVLRQNFENFELLLCEDGSQDKSLEIIRSFVERDPRIYLYRHPGGKNRGVSETRNLGINKARGHFIAFLDADDLLTPDSLSSRVKCFEENPDVGHVFSAATVIDKEGKPSSFNGSFTFGEFGPIEIPSRFDSLLLEGNGICTSTVMIRSSFLDGLRFATNLEMQYEDWLFWIELSRRCYFYQLSRALSHYRVHGNQAIGEDFYRYYCCCSYVYRRLITMGWDSESIHSIRGNFLFGLVRASLLRQSHGLPLNKFCRYFLLHLKREERKDFWKLIPRYIGKRIFCNFF